MWNFSDWEKSEKWRSHNIAVLVTNDFSTYIWKNKMVVKTRNKAEWGGGGEFGEMAWERESLGADSWIFS